MNTVYENATITSAILKDPDEGKPLTIFKSPKLLPKIPLIVCHIIQVKDE